MNIEKVLAKEAEENSWSHAYLLVGQREVCQKIIDEMIRLRQYDPFDVSVIDPAAEAGKKNEIKVDDIRRLLHDVSLTSRGWGRLVIIYGAERLNLSSGNILLKTLEEPPENVTLILVARNNTVLSTIISRCRVIKANESVWQKSVDLDLKFTEEDFATFSKRIEEIVKDNQVNEFLDSFEQMLRQKMLAQKKVGIVQSLEAVFECRRAIDSNANPRLALEDLILTIQDWTKSDTI